MGKEFHGKHARHSQAHGVITAMRHTWKSPAQLLELLIESVSKGGNLLLNVGPTARGTFDSRAQDRLESMGEWMKFNSRSIYGCTEAPAEFTAPG